MLSSWNFGKTLYWRRKAGRKAYSIRTTSDNWAGHEAIYPSFVKSERNFVGTYWSNMQLSSLIHNASWFSTGYLYKQPIEAWLQAEIRTKQAVQRLEQNPVYLLCFISYES